MRRLILLGLLIAVGTIPATQPAATADCDLHDDYNALLGSYVDDGRVRYAAWSAAADDLERLRAYVDRLEATAPEELERDAQLAYWINLYNAATLELVLDHYPVESIKKIGGRLRSPWKRNVVTVAGEDLTLNGIENDIIRPRFKDARIHFALNCASIGCPPLAAWAYCEEELDTQLDTACRVPLNDSRWVEVEPQHLRLTKIFDWYRDDFVEAAGSIEAFIAGFRAEDADLFADPGRLKIKYGDYDWDLNIIE